MILVVELASGIASGSARSLTSGSGPHPGVRNGRSVSTPTNGRHDWITVLTLNTSPAGVRGYNGRMAGPPPHKSPEQVHHRHRAYAMETTGLLIIAVVLLVLTLIRYWSAVHQLFR